MFNVYAAEIKSFFLNNLSANSLFADSGKRAKHCNGIRAA
jgi:hypothetical protein